MHRLPIPLLTPIALTVQLARLIAPHAQLAAPPAFKSCGETAQRVGRFAARVQHWQVALPMVWPVGRLGTGVLFRATANSSCCDEPRKDCIVRSEMDDALI